MAILAVIGIVVGMSFLCIKLTLYYMPFYFAGFLYGQIDGNLSNTKLWNNVKEISVAFSFVLWIFLMNRFNFFALSEGIINIAIRAIGSLTGCIAVCGLISKVSTNCTRNSCGVLLRKVGTHSLEIYLIHYLTLSMISMDKAPEFSSAQGILIVIVNFVLTVCITYLISNILNANRLLKSVLFGKFR